MGLKRTNLIIKHVWTEPKFKAQVEWMNEQPSPMQQILEQVGREAAEQFVAGQGWPDPDQVVSFTVPDPEPDWDWWEPRHDQLWRRQAARERELDALLATDAT